MAGKTSSTHADLVVRTNTHHDIELRLPPIGEVGIQDTISLVVTTPEDANGRSHRQVVRLNYRMVEAMVQVAERGW